MTSRAPSKAALARLAALDAVAELPQDKSRTMDFLAIDVRSDQRLRITNIGVSRATAGDFVIPPEFNGAKDEVRRASDTTTPVAGNRTAERVREAPSMAAFITNKVFNFELTRNGHSSYVWTYDLHVKNNTDKHIELLHQEWSVVKFFDSMEELPQDGHFEKQGFWGQRIALSSGESRRLSVAFACDHVNFELRSLISGQLPGQVCAVAVDQFLIPKPVQPSYRIDLDKLSDAGKLSMDSALALINYCVELSDSVHRSGPKIVDFSNIVGVSKSDSALLCLYLIYIGRNTRIRDFDLSPLMPNGLTINFIAADHFMKPIAGDKSEPGSTVTAVLNIEAVVVPVVTQALGAIPGGNPAKVLNQFVQAIPRVVAAIARGADSCLLIGQAEGVRPVTLEVDSERPVVATPDDGASVGQPARPPPLARTILHGAPAQPMPPEAEELFGSPLSGAGGRTYVKRHFPEEWFDNEEIARAARRTANRFKTRDKTLPTTPDEVEQARAADAFVKAFARRRQKLQTKAARPPEPR